MKFKFSIIAVSSLSIPLALWAAASAGIVPLLGYFAPGAYFVIVIFVAIFVVPVLCLTSLVRVGPLFFPVLGALASLPGAYIAFGWFGALADQAEMDARRPFLWLIPAIGALAGCSALIALRARKHAV
jgi:hypothetical protein